MKIKLKICDVDSPENNWNEEYDVECKNAEEYGTELINSFNDTLRPGEKPRKLLEVTVIDNKSVEHHEWYKTNITTIVKKGGMCYDTQKCSKCGITGKRYGLSEMVKRDAKYKAKIYQRCDTSKKHLEKLKNK
jgi:hypothetical protein